jgi:chemotaxis protein histidine kinase CheA
MSEIVQHSSAAMSQNLQVLKPSEILNIFSDYLAKNATSSKVVFIRGIYFKKKFDPLWKNAYDIVRDENDQREITIVIPPSLRDGLKDGALVLLGGNINRALKENGTIQLQLYVTRADVVQEQAISEEDMKRAEIRNAKSRIGYKNVDSILEDILYRGQRPRVALVFATTSITMSDFNAGKDAASSQIDFTELRVPFSKPQEVAELLSQLDQDNSYDAIALVRGGGGGIEALDDLIVLETVMNLTTPLICAVGHVEEKIFIKNIADKVAPTPNGLGAYFKDMVESVAEKRSKSRAALVEEVKKQYIQQIETAEKQNKSLQEQIEKMTKASNTAQENFKKQSEDMGKQLQTLQENLKSMQKSNEEQTKTFNDNLSALQKTNQQLQESLNNATAQATKAVAELSTANTRVKDIQTQLSKSQNKVTLWCALAVVAIVVAIIAIAFN